MSQLTLKNGRIIGSSCPVYIVAEVGLCHNGSVRKARELIRDAARAGVDAVKLQKRDVNNLATAKVLDALDDRFPSFGSTYREIRQHIEFEPAVHRELRDYATQLGVDYFVSVFDVRSADEMAALDLPVIKLASHVLSNKPLIEHVAGLGTPVLLSTGMASLEEIDETAAIFALRGLFFGLYHCVSIYPHDARQANLRLIRTLQERYGVPVGYSCHELEDTSSLFAVAAGAMSLERHVTNDRNAVGFDHAFALDMLALERFVRGVRETEAMMGDGRKVVREEEWVTRKKYHCSVVSAVPIAKGEVVGRDKLTTKNPGTGIPARRIDELVGRTAKRDIAADTLLADEMFE